MADDELKVKVTADTGDYADKMGEAKQATSDFGEKVDEAFKSLGEKFEGALKPLDEFVEGMGGLHEALADITGYEILKKALEELEAPFEKIKELSESAIKENVSAEIFATELGTTTTKAQALAAALQGVGASADGYAQMAMKLDRQVASNEEGLNDLGMVTRDQNGNLLDQVSLMQNAIDAMDEYKAGTDRNTIAMQLFGRSAKEVFQIARADDELQKQLAEDIVDQWAETTVATQRGAKEAEDAGTRLTDVFHNFAVGVGNDLNPALAHLENILADSLKPALDLLRAALEPIIALIDTLVTGFTLLFKTIEFGVQESTTAMLALIQISNQLGRGDFSGAAATFKAQFDGITEVAKEKAAELAKIGQEYNQRQADLFQTSKDAQTAGKPGGGNKAAPDTADADRQAANDALFEKNQQDLENMYGQSEERMAAEARKAEEEALREAAKAAAEKSKLADQEAKDAEKDAETSINDYAKIESEKVKTAQQGVAQRKTLGQISSADEITQLKALADQENQIEQTRFRQLEELYAEEPLKLKQVQNEELIQTQKYTQQIQQLNTKAAQNTQKEWQQATQAVSRAFSTSVQGIVLGTTTVSAAIGNLAKSILSELVNAIVQMGITWIETLLGIAPAADSTAAGQISDNAGVAFSAAFASTAAIPLIGPELAPEAAAAAGIAAELGGMSYLGASVASAAGGMMVDSDQLAMVHEDERILPARYSQGLDAMVNNAADNTQGGNNSNVTVHFNANGRITKSEMQEHSATIVGIISDQLRNNNSKLKGALA